MKFGTKAIVQKADCSETIREVNTQFQKGGWVFRALAFDLEVDADGRAPSIEVPILSSFDKAWSNRWGDHSAEAGKRWQYEAWMLREFKRGAYLYRDKLPDPADYLEWLALARHYEMPSRLVDFTYSFYVAAYFASSCQRKDACGVILAVDLKQLKENTEKELKKWNLSPPFDDCDFHNPVVFREFAFENRPKWVAAVAPSRRNERLLNQQGLFLCPGSIEDSFEDNLSATLTTDNDGLKLIFLHPRFRQECIRELREMNIDMRTLYPDLSGFAQSLRDLVYEDIPDTDGRFKIELERAISAKPRN
jgi:hypothetical protein